MRFRFQSFGFVVAASIALVAGLAALMLRKDTRQSAPPIILYCAAALREPMEEIVPLYRQQVGVPIEVHYGESQSILTNLEVSKLGDVFLPADESYIVDAQNKDLLRDVLPLVRMNGTLVVSPQYDKTITDWNDLFRFETRLAIANPSAAAISRLTQAHLGEAKWRQLSSQSVALGPVTDVANAVKLGAHVDAGIIWDSMVASPNYRMLKIVRLKELSGIAATTRIGVVKNSAHYSEALAFAQFAVNSCEDIWKKHGFTLVAKSADGGPAAKPEPARQAERRSGTSEIIVYAGAMLRPAIEDTIREFEAREGIKVTTVYNGCGILVSQMKAGTRPDLYFSCDASFMTQVADLFEQPRVISRNQLVIAVKKGNPHAIRSLKDLGKEGLRVGVGHEQQCALGAITQGVLIRSKTLRAVENNIATRAPSGDLLINQLRTGALDAAVAYISNVKPYEDELEAVKVEEVNCAPSQPIALSRTTAQPEVVQRLIRAIESTRSQERFEKLGFGWNPQP